MPLPKRYLPEQQEPALMRRWEAEGTYQFQSEDARPVYSIDSPPATVSGNLHLGHAYSYSHPDFMARFFRMRGWNVLYPMGFDDNGLPTERLVEKRLKVSAAQVGRQAFIEKCLGLAEEMEGDYRALWQRMGLSIDWRYTYRTIDAHARRCTQYSFIDLYQKGLAYRAKAPAIWCPECRTAIAQAELDDLQRASELITLPFAVDAPGASLPDLRIATTRPELLAACVAVFIHPQDARYQDYVGQQVIVPLYGQRVPVITDSAADPHKGTGAVMCCTFGDQADVAWWYAHHLPLVEAIGASGQMTAAVNLPGEALTGLPAPKARERIKAALAEQGLILERQTVEQSVRVHERCDTPVEYRSTWQWFIRVLENKATFLELGKQLRWHPASMASRYQDWVENLNWDWCISRQRVYAPPFPVWYCRACGAVMLADADRLPVDPLVDQPERPCACGSTDFAPETDVMDTWATSSVSPEIVTGWLDDPQQFARLFPMTLRPQAHDIIRTWTFYSIVKAWYHFGRLPWSDVFISGWGIAGEGAGKISKSKGGGPMPPMQMIERYSADALRYWAASTATGRDAVISEEKIQMGVKLVTKLWNVARFAEPFLLAADSGSPKITTPADRWLLARLDALVERVTAALESYEYAQAKAEIEGFFWHDLADNYIEMAKLRLYDAHHPAHDGAGHTLRAALVTLLKLLAPLLPFITETIWGELFAQEEGVASIHRSRWPEPRRAADRGDAGEDIAFGDLLVALATAARRYKSEHSLSLGSELARLQIVTADEAVAQKLRESIPDLVSVTRARSVDVVIGELDHTLERLEPGIPGLAAGIATT